MAGSFKHVVDSQGRLLCNEDLVGMLENGGDVFEAVEEMYGMIWLLADRWMGANPIDLPNDLSEITNEAAVEWAQKHYLLGLNVSPGIDAKLPREDDE